MSDVYLLSGISGLSFESAFLSPLFIFFPFLPSLLVLYICNFSANGFLFCFCFFVVFFSPENSQIYFVKG